MSKEPQNTLWFPFGHEIIRSGLWKRLSKTARSIYPVICTFADFQTGECYPSIRTIAKLSGTGTSRVILAIKELIEARLLERWSGNQTKTNLYRVTPPGGVAAAATPCSRNGHTPVAATDTGLSPERLQKETHVTTLNITTINNNGTTGSGTGGSPLGALGEGRAVGEKASAALLQDVAGEFDLKKVGLEELGRLIETYGVEWVGEAFREAVLRGKKTLGYLKGILENWKEKGKVVRESKRTAARQAGTEAQAERSRSREEELRRHEEARKAHDEVDKRLVELSERDRTLLKAQAEVECDQERVPGFVRDAMVQSKFRLKVAERLGIQGL